MPSRVRSQGSANLHYTLITHVRLIDPIARTSEACDLLLVRKSHASLPTVVAVGNRLRVPAEASVTQVRGSGLYACRSFVDLHAHTCEPGAMYKEDIRSATAAAVSGGFGDILAIPSLPCEWDDLQTLDYVRSNAAANGKVNLLPAVYLTRDNRGEELCNIDALLSHGVAAFYEEGNASPALLYTAMERLAKSDALLILRCNLSSLTAQNSSAKAAAAAEAAAVATALTLAEISGCRLHLTLISTALSIDLIRAAKKRGVRITCDTAPQYFTLTRSDLLYYGNLAKVDPPLRSSADREAVLEALADGTIDCIVSDHTPEPVADKRKPSAEAPAGMIGLQTVFALGMRELVLPGRLDLYRLIELLSVNPARILGLPDIVAPDMPAKLTLIDLEREYVLTEGMLDSKSKNCPWLGQTFQGMVRRNFSRIQEK